MSEIPTIEIKLPSISENGDSGDTQNITSSRENQDTSIPIQENKSHLKRCGAKRSLGIHPTIKRFLRSKKKSELPTKVDWRPILLPVRDQGENSTCVAMASACVKESFELIEYRAALLQKLPSTYRGQLSPQFIYDNRIDKKSQGMFGEEAMKIMLNNGTCDEKLYPYKGDNYVPIIPGNVIINAIQHRIKSFAAITTCDDLKAALTMGCCYIAFPCYNISATFWKPNNPSEEAECGHAVTVVGYDDEKKHFIIRNSWGDDWEDKGYTYMDYTEFGRQWEIFTIVDKEKLDPPNQPVLVPIHDPHTCCVIQ